MKLQLIIALAFTLFAVTACVVEPYGGGRSYYSGGYAGEHDYGRRVWRE
jgi:hypothetical protein